MPSQINSQCKCTWPCSRHGNCGACQEYHRKDGSLTNCGKDGKNAPPEAEAKTGK